ncbi:cation transporter [Geomonas sp.]|uniref:cation transporter n=1 Tax=Geomonas sp. TaxID=2651584 RepID=UPI002B46CF1E|nr:cation transporter [Geomonas sp.]HJV33460.1 cation transporter [Geomonas sp.]
MSDLPTREKLYRAASALAFFTIAYNVLEGVVSTWFGAGDESLALFGFGLDSFVEVISGVGIWHMVRRQRGNADRDTFERTALRITGSGFYLLAAGLVISGGLDLYQGHAPTTTFWGIVISCISLLSMWLLMRLKVKVGTALGSQAMLADAACTRVCLYLSAILLLSSAGYQLTGIGWLDSAGALGISWFCLKEGREAFGKARGESCGCSCSCKGSDH